MAFHPTWKVMGTLKAGDLGARPCSGLAPFVLPAPRTRRPLARTWGGGEASLSLGESLPRGVRLLCGRCTLPADVCWEPA